MFTRICRSYGFYSASRGLFYPCDGGKGAGFENFSGGAERVRIGNPEFFCGFLPFTSRQISDAPAVRRPADRSGEARGYRPGRDLSAFSAVCLYIGDVLVLNQRSGAVSDARGIGRPGGIIVFCLRPPFKTGRLAGRQVNYADQGDAGPRRRIQGESSVRGEANIVQRPFLIPG
ncbi:hypothetical protein D1872_228100 [compost metagenome]